MGPWRMLLLPTTPQPLRLKTHTSDPVPYLLYDSEVTGPGGEYTERYVADSPVFAGTISWRSSSAANLPSEQLASFWSAATPPAARWLPSVAGWVRCAGHRQLVRTPAANPGR
jgi:hypothetical protein